MSQGFDEKVQYLSVLATNFGYEFDKPLLSTWISMLKPYSPYEVRVAVMKVMEDYTFKTMPPFGVIKSKLDEIRGSLSRENEVFILALAEWNKLDDMVRKFGSYSVPEGMNPVTAYVIKSMGGWRAVCQWTESESHWRKKEFLDMWATHHDKEYIIGLDAKEILAIEEKRSQERRENGGRCLTFTAAVGKVLPQKQIS